MLSEGEKRKTTRKERESFGGKRGEEWFIGSFSGWVIKTIVSVVVCCFTCHICVMYVLKTVPT